MKEKREFFVGWHPFPSQLLANILGNTMRVKCFGDVLYYPKASSEPTLSRSHISVSNVFCFHQVSYSPMASDLSNKDKFPLLYSTVPPYSDENAARLAFLRYFRWKRIATIRQNEYVFNEVKRFLPSQVPDVSSLALYRKAIFRALDQGA